MATPSREQMARLLNDPASMATLRKSYVAGRWPWWAYACTRWPHYVHYVGGRMMYVHATR